VIVRAYTGNCDSNDDNDDNYDDDGDINIGALDFCLLSPAAG
jgi:hypothetical protein